MSPLISSTLLVLYLAIVLPLPILALQEASTTFFNFISNRYNTDLDIIK